MQELPGTTVTANLLSGGIDEVFSRTDGGGAFAQLKDALGSTIALADASGNVQTSYSYDPFGNNFRNWNQQWERVSLLARPRRGRLFSLGFLGCSGGWE